MFLQHIGPLLFLFSSFTFSFLHHLVSSCFLSLFHFFFFELSCDYQFLRILPSHKDVKIFYCFFPYVSLSFFFLNWLFSLFLSLIPSPFSIQDTMGLLLARDCHFCQSIAFFLAVFHVILSFTSIISALHFCVFLGCSMPLLPRGVHIKSVCSKNSCAILRAVIQCSITTQRIW